MYLYFFEIVNIQKIIIYYICVIWRKEDIHTMYYKLCGYIAYRYNEKKHWFCAEYLIYCNDEISWSEEPNDATIFESIEQIESIYSSDNQQLVYKQIVMTEEEVNF